MLARTTLALLLAAASLPLAAQDRDAPTKAEPAPRIIEFVAGRASHGWAAHEHRAGCRLLARALDESGLPVRTRVHEDGWPKDPHDLDGADAIVIFADGGRNHPMLPHVGVLRKLMQRGVGLVCLHYAVEVPKGAFGDALVDWIGGYFETRWSVNPSWVANFTALPEHPTTRGVRPFEIFDEWYYHMRFRAEMKGVTPILSAVPPAATLRRADGPHSNNEFVRATAGQPQHVAWACERDDGGRGFGFTGGHVHWNWGNDDFRTLVLNAIAWSARVDVPEDGVPSTTPTLAQLEAGQDSKPPDNYDPAKAAALLESWQK